ncbi:MAG: hypothetical protein WC643_04000, partial [Parcubacteria group bacterium]
NIDVVFSGINGATGKKDCPDFGSGTSPCSIYFLDSEGKVINSGNAQGLRVTDDISNIKAVRSVGTQGVETQRAIEAAVAGTGAITFSMVSSTSNCDSACNALVPPMKCAAALLQDQSFATTGATVLRGTMTCNAGVGSGFRSNCVCFLQN